MSTPREYPGGIVAWCGCADALDGLLADGYSPPAFDPDALAFGGIPIRIVDDLKPAAPEREGK